MIGRYAPAVIAETGALAAMPGNADHSALAQGVPTVGYVRRSEENMRRGEPAMTEDLEAEAQAAEGYGV